MVFVSGADVYDVDVEARRQDVAVADLAEALGAPPPAGGGTAGLYVDGLYQPGDFELRDAGLHDGATVSFAPPPQEEHPGPGADGIVITVLTGAAAGTTIPVGADGTYLVGRDEDCHLRLPDTTVSRRHCRLLIDTVGTVTVVNESGSVGTRVGGTMIEAPTTVGFDAPVLLGAVLVTVGRPASADRVSGFDRALRHGTGTVSLNRPPRLGREAASDRLVAPQAPDNVGKAPFNLASMVAPAVMGAVMVVALHNLLFGLFALMSPIMVLGNRWETGHRSSRNLRSSTRDFVRQLAELDTAVVDAAIAATAERRASTPSLPEILRRADLPSVRLWERRRDHDDFLRLGLGSTDEVWRPDVDDGRKPLSADVTQILAGHRTLHDVPLEVDLGDGGVVGVVGPRPAALAAARGLLCQAAVLHGPADLRVVVVAADDPDLAWDWTKWLPHTRDQASGQERQLLAAGIDDTADLLDSLAAEGRREGDGALSASIGSAGTEGPTTLYVVDGDELLSGRNAPARRLLSGSAGPAAGIVVAPTADRLPAVCTEIVTVGVDGVAKVQRPRLGSEEHPVRLAGLAAGPARAAAVALSRLDDPELHVAGATLPSVVRLGDLLGVGAWDAGVVEGRWRAAGPPRNRMSAPIGVAEDGRFELDLDRHGPHGLIGGTTGSGKSELLKTLVASLAASYPPEQLTFGLFDFKGGATFTDFADLPHTVGMASDLDVSLARRALRCLRAELLHRELVFDRAGVKDLVELNDRRAVGDAAATEAGTLPRLVVIIDEFAAMAKELSEEIGALADLTARGRSLGVHLLLATQKPSSSVNPDIKTNTRLRISLQVEDRQDSIDVVGIPDASTVNHKGRGYFRVGQGEVLAIQTGWSTSGIETDETVAVDVGPFAFGGARPRSRPAPTVSTVTELATLVDAVRAAHVRSGLPPQRRPWPDPLPGRLTLDELVAVEVRPDLHPADDVVYALADDPDHQTTYPVGWPLRHGNLLFYGVVGSGTTTALASVAMAFARGAPPAERHLYVIDSGGGELAPLEGLAHCASVIRAPDTERQTRLVRVLSREIDRRRGLAADERDRCPTVVLVLDNLEGFRSTFDDVRGSAVWDQFVRLYADGPEAGVHVVASVGRVGGIPSALSTVTANKVMFRLADTLDYGAVGLSRSALPTFVPGRAVVASDGTVVQVAVAGASLATAVDALAASDAAVGGPAPVGTLRTVIPADELVGRSRLHADRWDLVVAQREDDLAPGVLSLWEGEHALVAGPARCGRSSALLTLAAALKAADPAASVLAYGSRRSPLGSSPLVDRYAGAPDDLAALIDLATMAGGPTMLAVDDAELVDDPGGKLAALLGSGRGDVHVVAAGKADVLRSLYGHWTQVLRRSRAGLLLQPQLDRDGELLGAKLPFRLAVDLPAGRGFLVTGGDTSLVQVAAEPTAGAGVPPR